MDRQANIYGPDIEPPENVEGDKKHLLSENQK